MSSEISIHDNFILSFTVDCQERRITLRTAFHDREPPEHTDIIFSDVAAHHFERSNLNTILFDVKEATPEKVYAAYRDVFERNKNYGWPEIHYQTEKELMAGLKAQSMKGFLISSSYGMDGFVLARAMRLVPSL